MSEIKYYDVDTEKIWTESELRRDYEERKREREIDSEIYDTFEYYLNSCLLENNGSLERIADDWKIHGLQKSVANDIACKEIPYEKALAIIQKWKIFETWSNYEINNRPVNVDALRESIEQELGLDEED